MAGGQSFTLSIKALFDASDVKAKVGEIQKAFSNIKLPDNLKGNLDKAFSGVEKALTDFETKAQKGVSTKADAKGISTSIDGMLREFDKLQGVITQVQGLIGEGADLSQFFKLDEGSVAKIKGLQQEIEAIQAKIEGIKTDKLAALQNIINGFKKNSGTAKGATEALELFKQGDIEGAIARLQKLEDKLKAVKAAMVTKQQDTTSIEATITQIGEMKKQMTQAQTEVSTSMGEISSKAAEVASITDSAFQGMAQGVNDAANNTKELNNQLQKTAPAIKDTTTSSAQLNTELGQVKSRIQYFVGLTNAVNLFKRAITSAFNTVKELDAAMTETAVVTDKTISDMWNQLPEYTARANSLGVNTLDAYKSATLYYQQGLNDQQAAELSTETLKMARIAGLDAAEATDRMTNALRGFNMELNAMNAQRVDDVYSKLAAMSASNVDEISTAMTKVASLANNANMDFETTSAFLAQIIETTRESAETAGTALKTVVARFSEVKKLYSEGELKGTSEEGEAIDVNKISTALRTAGIDLNKYFLGEVGLDDIFMELASKWDSLTSVQQRYIATQAAGSRQQSRFIAMMQDYARTQELVSAAYNANGAAAQQFEKTQDSLQSKLARLKNAWDEFTMGIANSVVIKLVVDGLTLLLNIVNKITGAFGPAIGGVLKFTTALAALTGLRKAFSDTGIITKGLGKFSESKIGQIIFGTKGDSGKELVNSAKQAGDIQKRAATESGEILKEAAREAAITEEKGAVTETTTEQQGAVVESATEQLGASNENAIEELGAFKKSTIEETAATEEAATEISGAVQEEAIEAKGSLNGDLGNYTDLFKSGVSSDLINGKSFWNSRQTKKLMQSFGGNLNVPLDVLNATDSVDDLAGSFNNLSVIGKTAANSTDDVIAGLSKMGVASEAVLNGALGTGSIASGGAAATAQVPAAIVAPTQTEALAAAGAGIGGTIASIFIPLIVAAVAAIAIDDYVSSGEIEIKRTNKDIEEKQQELDWAKENSNETTIRAAEANLSFAEAASNIAKANQVQKSLLRFDYDESYAGAIHTVTDDRSWWDQKTSGVKYNKDWTQEEIDAYNSQFQPQIDEYRRQAAEQITKAASTALGFFTSDSGIVDTVSSAYSELLSNFEFTDFENKIGNTNEIASDLESLISIANNENGKKILDVIGGNYTGAISNEELIDLFENLTTQQKATIQQLTQSNSYDISSVLADYNATLRDTQRPIRNKAMSMFEQAGIFDEEILDLAVSKLTTGQLEELTGYNDQWASFGKEFNQIMLTKIGTAMSAGNWDGSKLKEFAASISDNPVMALKAIKEAASSSDNEVRLLAESLQETVDFNSGAFSRENQLTWFATSTEYEEIEKQIQSIIETNGKLTSDNIEDLAKSSETLATMLDSGTMSANGLAAALTILGKGNVTILDLNNSVLQLFESFDSVGNAIQRAGDFIKNFNPGEDWGDALDFITDATDKIQEFVGNKEFGNPQYKNYWKSVFGTEAPTNAAEAQKGIDLIKEMSENNGMAFWEKATGFQRDENGKLDMQLYGENGYEGWITKEDNTGGYRDFVKSQVEGNGYQFSDEYYDLMMRNLANYQPDFVKKVAAQELDSMMGQYASAAGEAKPSKADIQAIADAWGLDPQEVLNAYNENQGTNYEFDALEEQTRRYETSLQDAVKNAGIDMVRETEDEYLQRKTSSELLTELGADENGVFSIDTLTAKIKEVVPEVADGSMTVEEWFNEQAKQAQESGQPLKLPVEYDVVSYNEDTGTYSTEHVSVEVEVENLQQYQAAMQQITEQGQKNVLFKDAAAQAQNIVDTLQGLADLPGADNITESIKTAKQEAQDLRKMLEQIPATVVLSPTAQTVHIATDQGGSIDVSLLISAAKGGIVSAASGTIQSGLALTGEEDPEIVWNKEKGYAYLAGKNGPEINNLQPGDQVFNAQDTRAILRRSGIRSFAKGTINSYYSGTQKRLRELIHEIGPYDTIDDRLIETLKDKIKDDSIDTGEGKDPPKSSGGGGASSKKKPEWENTLDWLYNLMEDIAELERTQTRLSEQHDRYLEDVSKSGRDLYNLTKAQLQNLLTQRDNYQEALERRIQEMREQITEADEELTKYIWWNAEDKTIEIDWDAINEIDNEDTFKEVTDLVSKAEKIQDQIDEADDALWEIEGEIKELEQRYLQEYIDFQKRVYDAVVFQYQQQIDELTSLNETLNDSNDQILNAIQKEIDLQRQIRDNTQTENDISEKEARLAYLRRDTTGANEEEIKALEKEIEEARRDYTDTLIDQAIERLEEQNSDAAEQRQKQIDIMSSQLDYWKEVGAFWPQVAQLLDEGINGEGSLLQGSTLEKILREAEGWKAMSKEEQQQWTDDLRNSTKQAAAYLFNALDGLEAISEGVWAMIPESSIPKWRRDELAPAYATGGLNTKSGHAWLDGTANEPEYVLNARQTDAFLRLAEVLPEIFSRDTGVGSNYNSNVYVDLNINVGEIGSDYDVDRLVNRVKDDIYSAAAYRNVNAVSFTR